MRGFQVFTLVRPVESFLLTRVGVLDYQIEAQPRSRDQCEHSRIHVVTTAQYREVPEKCKGDQNTHMTIEFPGFQEYMASFSIQNPSELIEKVHVLHYSLYHLTFYAHTLFYWGDLIHSFSVTD